MSEKSIKFGYEKVNKRSAYKNKKPSKVEDIDTNKILVSKKELYGKEKKLFRYIIGYNDDDVIRPLCIRLLQMVGYVKYFDNNKTMSFNATDNRLLRTHKKIWEKSVS